MKKTILAIGTLIALSGYSIAQPSGQGAGPGPVPCAFTACTVASLNVTGGSTFIGQLGGNTSNWRISASVPTATVPNLIPNSGSPTTGFGSQASGNANVVVGGAENMRWTSTGPLAIVLPTDATTTDNTMCINTSTHVMSSGTGTLGICLGTSSARFKTGITPLVAGLPEIMALSPKAFYLDAAHGDPKKLIYGFIAEDMVNVLPKLVGLDKQGRPNSADYLGVVPVLVKAVQQQESQITNLRAANDNLARRVAKLERHQ